MSNIQRDLLDAFEQSGLTYDELAKRTNLPKSALYRYLNGDTEKIPIDRFQAICSELHVDAGSVLGWKSINMDLQLFSGTDQPQTKEARIVSGGMDKLPQEQREQILNVLRAMFSNHPELFDGKDE